MTEDTTHGVRDELAGTARLSVVAPAAIAAFVAQSLYLYALPLYFAHRGLPDNAWETFFIGFVAIWLPGAPLTGALCSRFGERVSWGLGGLMLMVLAACATFTPLAVLRLDAALFALGCCAGAAGCLLWVGGISLAQVVPARRKGLANMTMMLGLGAGSIAAPPLGRSVLAMLGATDAGFAVLLSCVGALGVLSGALVALWGQRSGESAEHCPADTYRLAGFAVLLRNPRFRFFALTLGLVAGAMMQTGNIYTVYRARELGLIQGAVDTGWANLQTTGYAMQFLGSLLVWRLAGRAAGPWLAAAGLALFGAFGLAIGFAPAPIAVFPAVAGFEFCRQVIRWLQTGYVTEHVDPAHRASAVGLTTMMSGTGAVILVCVVRFTANNGGPGVSPSFPFFVAGGMCLFAALALAGLTGRAIRPARHEEHQRV